MARTGIFHHLGTFLLFAATILLIITSITAPVVNNFSILRVKLTNDSIVSFGTFGHCVLEVAPLENDEDYCSRRMIGYNPAKIMEGIDNADYNSAAVDTSRGLTRVMVLHPVAAGLAFISFCLALGAGVLGSILAGLVSALTWIVTLVVMATDFTAFGIVKNRVNRDGSGSKAYYSVGMWTILAAMLCLFFGTIIVFFTCLSARMHKRKEAKIAKTEAAYTAPRRRWPWQRRY